ncbi:hypothetical protein Fmac_031083 [Flemingia macrophylla]|uniref:Uncharacterized protein n=1 Tax=Flemingia macrophylla TaxID=520843 RepID=A0ABD1L116_9FABA
MFVEGGYKIVEKGGYKITKVFSREEESEGPESYKILGFEIAGPPFLLSCV